MTGRLSGLAIALVALATLACGGSGGEPSAVAPAAAAAAPMIVDLRFTSWECYEGGYYEGIEFKSDGRCGGSSDGWKCSYVQTGNDISIDWKGPDGEAETWTGVMVDPRGKEMGGTSKSKTEVNDFRCTR